MTKQPDMEGLDRQATASRL